MLKSIRGMKINEFSGKPNISLIGFMCSGKTTLGRNIARLKNLSHHDTDKMIINHEGKSITDIFDEHGEKYFRTLEAAMIESLKNVKGSVISCGGGVVLNEANMQILREISVVIYLHMSPEKIYERLGRNNNRPLLTGEETESKISGLFESRKPLYMKYCHKAVDVTDFSIEESVALILGMI